MRANIYFCLILVFAVFLVKTMMGLPLIWDATCVDTLAPSHLASTSLKAGAAAAAVSQVDFYIYQFLSNTYKRSFVEWHFKWCSLIHEDQFFGAAMKQGKLAGPCPYPPGDYHMYNMTISPKAIPPGFPFEKGRIFANATHRGVDVCNGFIDMELKEKKKKDQI